MASIYEDGTYAANNEGWGALEAPWKAKNIAAILADNDIHPQNLIDIGCGSGVITSELLKSVPSISNARGYDISPIAIGMTNNRDGLQYICADILEQDVSADLVTMIDLFEHVPDYIGFLEACLPKGRWFVFHIPLEMNVFCVLRDRYLVSRARFGHLHYFSQKSALATLEDAGYRIIDWRFDSGAIDMASKRRAAGRDHRGWKTDLGNIGRRCLGSISKKWSAKIIGGYSLMVLAESQAVLSDISQNQSVPS